MGLFTSFDISDSGLTAERLRMDIISNNIANVNTTITEDGTPYKRQMPVFQARLNKSLTSFEKGTERQFSGNGVRVIEVAEDQAPFKKMYDPSHPHADKEGYVKMPNVNVIKEMVDMITASRAYEANISVMTNSKNMFKRALDLGNAAT
jgi:flagellar basal-body rod protein FlgC